MTQQTTQTAAPQAVSQAKPSKPRSMKPLIMVLLLSLSPVVAAILVYFNPDWRPAGNTNYGQLVEPQRPMPSPQALPLTSLDGQPFDINSLKGQWLLVAVDSGACDDACAKKLFIF